MNNINTFIVFISCVLGLIFSVFVMVITTDYSNNYLTVTELLNRDYLTANKPFLLNGLFASLFGAIAAYIKRVNYIPLIICILLTGLIVPVLKLFEDFEAWEYFPSVIIEPLVPFMLISFIILGISFIINLKFKRTSI